MRTIGGNVDCAGVGRGADEGASTGKCRDETEEEEENEEDEENEEIEEIEEKEEREAGGAAMDDTVLLDETDDVDGMGKDDVETVLECDSCSEDRFDSVVAGTDESLTGAALLSV